MRSRPARLLLGLGLVSFAVGSLAVASSRTSAPSAGAPRMASPLSGPPQRAGGGARSHGLAQPHRSPLIRTIPPGRDSGTGTRRSTSSAAPPAWRDSLERCLRPSQDGALQEGAGGRSMPAPIVGFDGVTNRRRSPAARYERRHRPGSLRADRQRLVRGLQPKRNRGLRTCEQQRALHGYPDLRLTQPGRPVVLYDQFSERWLASQFATGPLGYECVSVSETSDPTGSGAGTSS